MRDRKFIPVLMLVSALAAILLAACASGVPQSDYDAVKQQLSAQEQKAAALQQQLSAKDKDLADLQKKAGSASGGVLGAKQAPAPPPRPTPTAVPPGYTPPPPPVPPASFTEPVKLYIRADTVTAAPGESEYNVDSTAGGKDGGCYVTGVFARGQRMVWRFEVVDVTTGKRLTDQDVASAVIKLPTGEEFKGRFGRHGATNDAPWFWTTAWNVPPTYPLGVLDWTLNVSTKDGKSASYKPWVVSTPERGIEARTFIVE